jgi:hypothetical protein
MKKSVKECVYINVALLSVFLIEFFVSRKKNLSELDLKRKRKKKRITSHGNNLLVLRYDDWFNNFISRLIQSTKFFVKGTGSESQERMSDEELAKQLIEYVTEEKVSFLEDLASKFNLKTQDVITKINQLEQEGRLTGVIDDRGKFIFITPQELQNVANFINLRGTLDPGISHL